MSHATTRPPDVLIKSSLRHPMGRGRSRLARLAAVAVPVLLAARPLGNDRFALSGRGTLPAHAVDVWGEHSDAVDFDLVAARAASRALLNRGGPAPATGRAGDINRAETRTPAPLHGGFTVVGSVALLEGDETTATAMTGGFGIQGANLPNITAKFIQAFGDDYDQVAVFLSFSDRASLNSLAYQLLAKNDIRGLGIPLSDHTKDYGSAGKMQTVLNMKRIGLYGRGAADDPDNGLYAVWAQEAAHRWLVYFRLQRTSDPSKTEALLGRQFAHWKNNVQADGSIMDGYTWVDNGDGTFTSKERGVRYGMLDQYGMGLRKASEVPPFFMIDAMSDLDGRPITAMAPRLGKYKGSRIDLTIDDIIRANGPREPERDPVAEDLRMGVVLVSAPGQTASQLIGEAFQIDNSRRLWTDFYNGAGGGRGKVCTQLLRPCRGDAFELSDLEIVESPLLKNKDGAVSAGEPVKVNIKVTNTGDAPGRADLQVDGGGVLTVTPGQSGMLPAGQSAVVSLDGRVAAGAACSRPFTLDVRAPGAKGPSRVFFETAIGLQPKQVESFDGGMPAGWRVNPDGTDTKTQGRWALGTPQRFEFFGYTLQPGAAYSGNSAFVTGLAVDELDTDNVEGRTTLESAAFGIKGLREPHLSYQVYFVSSDFAAELLVPGPSGSMRVEASLDGGAFTEVDRLTGMSTGWQRRIVRLSEKLPAAATASEARFRFIAEEVEGGALPVVEAVIDDVGIYAESAGCDPAAPPPEELPPPAPESGCSCRVGAARAGVGIGPFALTLLGLLLWRRRSRGGA